MTTTTDHLTRIAAYLERQTDLAFLDYRRATQLSPGVSVHWHDSRFISQEDILYSRWIAIGDAYYLVQDVLKRHEDQMRMWREFLLALMAHAEKSRHDVNQVGADLETTQADLEESGIQQAQSELS